MFVFALIMAKAWTILCKDDRKTDKIKLIRASVFFFAYHYFVFSAVKFYFGEGENTLAESLWDCGPKTYLHYGIMFVLADLIALILIRLIPKQKFDKFVCISDCAYLVVYSILIVLMGRINNKWYCILYMLCTILGLMLSWRAQYELEYIHKGEVKEKIQWLLPFFCVPAIVLGIYLPNELFINNSSEFTGKYIPFLCIMLIGSILSVLIGMAVMILFVPKKLFQVMGLLIGGAGCAAYVQEMFLNGKLTAMNGDEQNWSDSMLIINALVWIAILAIAAVGGYYNKTISKILKGVCIYISLIQIVSLGWLIITSNIDVDMEAAMTKEGSLELAHDNNVLVFVLDSFDVSWFEEIYEQDRSILEPLADFTYYNNGTSQFAHTNPGIPYMLTGVAWDDNTSKDYFSYAYEHTNALATIALTGTDVRVYTDKNLMPDSFCSILGNYSNQIVRGYDCIKTFGTMIKTSMYKAAPFAVKQNFSYYSDDISEMASNDMIWSIDNDLIFYDDLMKKGLSMNESYDSAFRFYHMRGPHAPFYLSADLKYEPTGRQVTRESQGKGCLRIVYEYLEQLKALEQYDNATIILTADHGQGNIMDTEKASGRPDRTSRPIFMIKKPGEHHDSMVINSAPVSQAELIPTILKAFHIDYTSYGRTFDEVPNDEIRLRTYVDEYAGHNIIYEINGNAGDIGSWTIKKAEYR